MRKGSGFRGRGSGADSLEPGADSLEPLKRRGRFIWPKGVITWAVERPDLPELVAAVAVGVASWDWHLRKLGRSLVMAEEPGRANIVASIRRVKKRRRILAYSQFPNPSGRVEIVFDAGVFHSKTQEGRAQIAAHEIGHALGIRQHLQNPNAVMNSQFIGPNNGRLCRADVVALRRVFTQV